MKAFSVKRPRLVIGLAVSFALLIALALWFLPELARRVAVEELSSLVDAPVHIEDVDLNLFTRRARVTGLHVGADGNGPALVHLPKSEFKFSLFPLIRGVVVLRSVSFFQPRVFVERFEGNRFNLIEAIRPQESEPGGFDVAVEQLEIRGGEVVFVDRTLPSPVEHVLKNIQVKTGKVSTSPELTLTPTSFNLVVGIGAGTLTVGGSATFLGAATGVELSAQWKNFDPAMFSPYLPPEYKLDFAGSSLGGEARYLLKYEGANTTAHALSMAVDLGPFRLLQPERSEPALTVARLQLQETRWDFLTDHLRVGTLVLNRPRLLVEQDSAGILNLSRLFSGEEPGPATPEAAGEESKGDGGPALKFDIEQARVEEGIVDWKDRTINPEVSAVLEQLQLTARGLSFTDGAAPAQLEGDARLGAGTVRVTGTLSPEPFAARLAVDGQDLNYDTFRGYVDSAFASGRSRGSRINGRLALALSSGKTDDLDVVLSGHLEARDWALELSETSRPLKTDNLRIEIHRLVAAPKLDVDIGRLQLTRPDLRLERDRKGDLTLQSLWKKPADGTPPESAPEPLPLTVRRVEVNQGRVRWLDRAVSPEVTTAVENLRMTLSDIRFAPGAKPGLIEGEGNLGKTPVRVKGSLSVEPFSTRLSIVTKKLPLKPYRGYIDPVLENFQAREGELSGEMEIALGPSRGEDLAFSAKGKLEANGLIVGLAGLAEPPFKAKSLAVEIARLNTTPALDVEISRVQLSGGDLKLELDEKGALNLKQPAAVAKEKPAREKSSPTKAEGAKSRIVIGSLKIDQSSVDFIDRSLSPGFQTRLTDIAVDIGRTGTPGGRTPITLRAKLDGAAAIELKGWLTPFERPLRVQLQGQVLDYDLAQLNPYASKYIRYEIRRGRVTTDIDYSYNEGDLDGRNEISIRHLQLGEQLGKEFDEQVGISLKLALALLEDLDGRIRLQVPVKGDLKSPDFTIAGVVWKAFRNALIGFLTAPFKLLGNVLTVGGKITEIRIDPVRFVPGTATLDASGEKQLGELADFLKNKPRLEIETRGAAAAQEGEILKRRKLKQEIKPAAGESYGQALLRLYRAAGGTVDPNKPPSPQTMESFLAKKVPVTDEELLALAQARERVVSDALVRLGVAKNRVFDSGDERLLKKEPSGWVEFELLY